MRPCIILLVGAVSAFCQLNYSNLTVVGGQLGYQQCTHDLDITACLSAVVTHTNPRYTTVAIDPGTYQISEVVTIGEDQALKGQGQTRTGLCSI
jgi:hypothetical protein